MGISKNIRTIEDQAPARKSAPESTPESRGTVKQRTLKTSIDCSGIGLHSGVKVSMTLNPADANTGIRRHGRKAYPHENGTWPSGSGTNRLIHDTRAIRANPGSDPPSRPSGLSR